MLNYSNKKKQPTGLRTLHLKRIVLFFPTIFSVVHSVKEMNMSSHGQWDKNTTWFPEFSKSLKLYVQNSILSERELMGQQAPGIPVSASLVQALQMHTLHSTFMGCWALKSGSLAYTASTLLNGPALQIPVSTFIRVSMTPKRQEPTCVHTPNI